MLHHPENSPDIHKAYEAAINRLIPRAAKIVDAEERNGQLFLNFNWDRRFHEVMNELAREEGLREL